MGRRQADRDGRRRRRGDRGRRRRARERRVPIPFLGTLIGVAVGALIAWIASACEHSNPDKIPGHANLTLSLKDVTKSSYGKMAGNGHLGIVHFHHAGAKYSLDFAWRVLGPGVGVEPNAMFI